MHTNNYLNYFQSKFNNHGKRQNPKKKKKNQYYWKIAQVMQWKDFIASKETMERENTG